MLVKTFNDDEVKGHLSIWNHCNISLYWSSADGRSLLLHFCLGTRPHKHSLGNDANIAEK